MTNPNGMKIAVIGGGISGIAAACMLQKNGFVPVIFEQSERPGGVWALAYPNVHLQNIDTQYHISDFPWPFKPDFHPTGEQILRYMNEVVDFFKIDLRTRQRVVALKEKPDGWLVRTESNQGIQEEFFGYVIISSGQYTNGKHRPSFPGEQQFQGQILTERDIHNLDQFNDKRVAVIGFGKSALDMVSFAAPRAAQAYHVFRTARWPIPDFILGIHSTYILFSRFGSSMVPSWAPPSAPERFLHNQMRGFVGSFWQMIAKLFRFQLTRGIKIKDQAARERIKTVQPAHGLVPDMRSAIAMAPERYYPSVADGRIQPYHAELASFSAQGIVLNNGREIACDMVILSLGSEMPIFPFLPQKYRQLLEAEPDGAQLYRHLVHPRIPRIGFAGFNHGFMHIPSVEIGTLWLCAALRGELELPSPEAQEQTIEHIRAWKRQFIHFEPSRSCAVNTRYQQYIDMLLLDLGLSPYRKLPNIFAEIFARYTAWDYHDVFEDYERKRAVRNAPLKPQPFDT